MQKVKKNIIEEVSKKILDFLLSNNLTYSQTCAVVYEVREKLQKLPLKNRETKKC
jgi:hypothetical protein